jgi:hypothetical protein
VAKAGVLHLSREALDKAESSARSVRRSGSAQQV